MRTPVPYNDVLRDEMSRRLDRHDRRAEPLDGRRHAAVAVLVVESDAERDGIDPLAASEIEMAMLPGEAASLDGTMNGVAGGASFVLCRRGSAMRAHARQWALPGGRIDEGESVIDAALRETHEEVGVRLGTDAVLGLLDDYVTRSGYVITPVVLWGGNDVVLAPNPEEVAFAYRIGFHELLRDDSPRFVSIPESPRPVVQVLLGQDAIHAPTGAVLVQFRWVALEGRTGDESRVAHFEQPVFAWK